MNKINNEKNISEEIALQLKEISEQSTSIDQNLSDSFLQFEKKMNANISEIDSIAEKLSLAEKNTEDELDALILEQSKELAED